jgi:hypothetical protein
MNDLDKKDLLELANIIKAYTKKLSLISPRHDVFIDSFEEIIGSADAIIEIVENKPHKIERMI